MVLFKMKTKTIAIAMFAILFATNWALAQNADLKSKIDFIKAEYQSVMANVDKMESTTYYRSMDYNTHKYRKFTTDYEKAIKLADGVAEDVENVDVYKQNGSVRYIVIESNGELGSSKLSFYFKDGNLFFLLDEFNGEDEEGNDASNVNRYYIDGGNLIQFLAGKAKKNIKPNSAEFKQAQAFVTEKYNSIKSLVK